MSKFKDICNECASKGLCEEFGVGRDWCDNCQREWTKSAKAKYCIPCSHKQDACMFCGKAHAEERSRLDEMVSVLAAPPQGTWLPNRSVLLLTFLALAGTWYLLN